MRNTVSASELRTTTPKKKSTARPNRHNEINQVSMTAEFDELWYSNNEQREHEYRPSDGCRVQQRVLTTPPQRRSLHFVCVCVCVCVCVQMYMCVETLMTAAPAAPPEPPSGAS